MGSRNRSKYIHDRNCPALTHDGECDCPRPRTLRPGYVEPPSPQFAALQVMLSYAVDKAREIPRGTVTQQQDALVGLYMTQIVSAVVAARVVDGQ